MRRAVAVAVAVAALGLVAASEAAAQPAARKKLALATLATLGSESRAAEFAATERQLAVALASASGYEVVPLVGGGGGGGRRRPAAAACDGEPACLADLGAAVGAALVVHGEVGGLGAAHVVYLELIDVAERREVRSTTLELDPKNPRPAVLGAATRLVAPGRYVGGLALDLAVPGATIFVDGDEVRSRRGAPISLPVGPHAVRVTHPEYRDFVRFVDVGFGTTLRLPVALERYGVIDRELARDGGGGPAREVILVPAPWYRRPLAVAAGGALVLIASALVVGALSDGIDVDHRRDVP